MQFKEMIIVPVVRKYLSAAGFALQELLQFMFMFSIIKSVDSKKINLVSIKKIILPQRRIHGS